MAITRTPIIDDDGSGTTGTPLDNAWKQELYNQIDAADTAGTAAIGGNWIAIPYSAGNFTATAPMTWTVEAADVGTLAYTIIAGHTAIIMVNIQTTTLGGTATTDLFIALPFTPIVTAQAIGRYTGAGMQPLLLYTAAGQPRLGLIPLSGVTFTLGTNNQLFQGTMITQV